MSDEQSRARLEAELIELIPALRQQGKTLLVVSHDDRYFAAADRVLTLDNGRIVAG